MAASPIAATDLLATYRSAAAEREALGVPPLPLSAPQAQALTELLQQPPAGEEAFLLDLLIERIPPGVDEAAYVKAGWLSAVAQGLATSPLLDPRRSSFSLVAKVALAPTCSARASASAAL